MTLWDLLIAICCVMPLAGSLATAKLSKTGFGGRALAIVIGLALGVCCARTMWAVGNNIAARIRRHSEPVQERYFRALYFTAMLWIVFSLFLGEWVSSLVLRLAF